VGRKNVEVHVAPADGLQAYTQPYPRFVDADFTGPRINAGEQLDIAVVQGAWVQVSTPDDGVIGWVDGRKLIPPVTAPVTMAPIPETTRMQSRVFAVTFEAIVAAVASIGIAVGALLDWLQGRHAVSAMGVPMQYLFDNRTAANQPRLGYLLLGVAAVALVLSFIPRAAIWRVLLGAIVIAVASAFCIQLAQATSGTNKAFLDVVGAGPWVTGTAGLLLLCSPALRQRPV
jgi:hypothetical protein